MKESQQVKNFYELIKEFDVDYNKRGKQYEILRNIRDNFE